MPKTTKLGGPSHELPADVVDGLVLDEVPKGLVVTDVDKLTDDQAEKVELGAAKVLPQERGEARLAREQAALADLVERKSNPEGKGESKTDGAKPVKEDKPAPHPPAPKRG